MSSLIGTTVSGYQITQHLAEGSSGSVYLARSPQGSMHAIKVIQTIMYQDDDFEDLILAESHTCNKLRHPNILYQEALLFDSSNYYFLSEYCSIGSAQAYLMDHPELELNEEFAIKIMKGVCQGYSSLYEKGIMHRDIKLENIFLKQMSDGTMQACLGDFGFAKKVEDVNKKMPHSMRGTISYMAPEIINNCNYNYKCDIFSIGICYYMALFRECPLKGCYMSEIRAAYANGVINFQLHGRKISKLSVRFIHECCQAKPENRPSIEAIMKHSLFNLPIRDVQAQCFEKDMTININESPIAI